MKAPVMMAVLFVIALGVYGNTISNGFLLDDTFIVEQNPLIQKISGIPRLFTLDYWAPHFKRNLYRPLTMTSYALNFVILGPSPTGFHLVNILLHGMITLLVFRLTTSLTDRKGLAFLAALIFAIHPIHTEAVAGVVGRAELLACAFFLSGWIMYRCSTRRRLFVSLSALAYFLALMSKESAVTLLAVLLLDDLITRKGGLTQRLQIRLLLHVAALGIYLVIRHFAIGIDQPMSGLVTRLDNPLAFATGWERVLTATALTGQYLKLLVFPLNLSADYSLAQTQVLLSPWNAGLIVAVLAGLLVLAGAILSVRRCPVITLAVLSGGVTFFPVSNIPFPIGTAMGERLVYIPSFGFCLALSAVIVLMYERIKRKVFKRLVVLLVSLAILGMAVRTVARNADWSEPERLWATSLEAAPRSIKLHVFMAQEAIAKGDLERAESFVLKALELGPDVSEAWAAKGFLLGVRGEDYMACEALRQAARFAPRSPDVKLNLGVSLFNLGKMGEAEKEVRDALALRPFMPRAYLILGMILEATQRYAEAARAYGIALTQDPGLSEARAGLIRLQQLFRTQGRSYGN
ncbi:tetratricopeptide repeat protein [Acidobacteriota bacterium]